MRCPRCEGSGRYEYSDGGTWRAVGANVVSMGSQWDTCNLCWGSGDNERPFTNLLAWEERDREQVKHIAYLEQTLNMLPGCDNPRSPQDQMDIRAKLAELEQLSAEVQALREKNELYWGRKFPVMLGPAATVKMEVPWGLVEPFNKSALRNHDQTLERLAERGGLSPQELWCVVNAKKWRERPEGFTEEKALEWIRTVFLAPLLPPPPRTDAEIQADFLKARREAHERYMEEDQRDG